jgi:hypothetical protein
MITCDLCGEAKIVCRRKLPERNTISAPEADMISRRGARTSHVIKDRATLKP